MRWASVVFLVVAGCVGESGDAPPRHVILITADTLRADHLSLYGYPRATSPALDTLAADGTVVERAVCQYPKTGPSLASLFTGRYPLTTGIRINALVQLPDSYSTLAEMFEGDGFATAAVVSNPVLPREKGWSQGFDEYLETWRTPGAAPPSADPYAFRAAINAARVNELALPLVGRLAAADRVFLWVHYSDPHAPYVLPADVANPFLEDGHGASERQTPGGLPAARRIGDERRLDRYVAHYDGNILFMDGRIGELLDRLDEVGILADALVVFTADHGESLGEHDYWFEHGRLPYNTTAHVPLVFHKPGFIAEGRRIDRPVGLIDLYPTLAAAIESAQDLTGLEGDSLLPELRPAVPVPFASEPSYVFSEAGGGGTSPGIWRSVQDARWKLAYHPPMVRGGPRRARFEVYDLIDDPGETRNLHADYPAEWPRLHRALMGWMRAHEATAQAPTEAAAVEPSEEEKRALRALGYLE